MGLAGKREPLRRWKLEAGAVVEGVARQRQKARVPHQPGIERAVDDHRRAAHVARAGTIGADHAVVLDADGDGLGVTEAVGRRVAAAAGVVVVETGQRVEPEQPPQVGQLVIDVATEPAFQRRFDATGEAGIQENRFQLLIQRGVALRVAAILSKGGGCQRQ